MTLQQTFNNATGQNQTLVQDGEYTAESVNGPREALTKDTKLKLSQIKREAVTDKTYKIGEISQKTGLQKQPDGSWAPPKKGAPAGAKSLPNMSGRDAVRFNTLLKQNAAAGRGEGDGLTPGEVDELNHLVKQAGGRKEPFKPEELKAMSAARGDRTPKQDPEATARIEKRYAENEARSQKAMEAAPDFKIGSDVKVKVNGGRPGKITEIRGDVVTVEMPAQGKLPARRDQYYKSDLEAAETKPAAKKEAPAGETKKTGPALSKVSHFDLDMARNQMNTTPDEDRMLDYFVTEMHEDRTSLEEIIKRQDGIFKRNEGIYPKEEKVYKSLREKIINHFLEAEK